MISYSLVFRRTTNVLTAPSANNCPTLKMEAAGSCIMLLAVYHSAQLYPSCRTSQGSTASTVSSTANCPSWDLAKHTRPLPPRPQQFIPYNESGIISQHSAFHLPQRPLPASTACSAPGNGPTLHERIPRFYKVKAYTAPWSILLRDC